MPTHWRNDNPRYFASLGQTVNPTADIGLPAEYQLCLEDLLADGLERLDVGLGLRWPRADHG